MGKRSRNRHGHKNGRHNHHHSSTHHNNLPFRKDHHSTFKHKPPQKEYYEQRKKHVSLKEKTRSVNESFKSSLPSFASSTTVGDNKNGTFASRKRSLMEVEFVYPKKNGVKEKYRFDKTNGKKTGDGYEADREDQNTPVKQKTSSSSKSIQEILYPSRIVATSEDTSSNKVDASSRKRRASDDETSSSAEGQLSGRSVEDAVRDRVGCRPRSNSTDGELNLPQRGLCDERTVLESYRWRFDRCNVGCGKPKGFNNLGNTCYLNSTLQCLAHIPPFCQSLLTLSSSNNSNSPTNRGPSQGKKITLMLKNLFARAHASNGSAGSSIAPRMIVSAVPTLGSIGSRGGYRFRPGRQEDCHEFLVHLLDAMNDGELREAGINQHKSGWRDRLPIPRLDETTFIHRTFGGYFRSQVRCPRCDYKSNTYDPFLDLSLEVSKHSCNSVLDALKDFTRKETLDMDNRWKCSGCKKLVCPTKQLTVFRPPLALCIQLKRFAFSGGFRGFGGFIGGKKITKPIDFPSVLKLPLSDGRSCQYSLTGIVIHLGSSATSGHYTACIKKPSSDGKSNWFHMDDSFVEPISEKTVLRQKDAYLLFYCREEVKIEYPTPPLRSSMSADEAKELGRIRSLARGVLKSAESSEPVPAKKHESETEQEDSKKLHPLVGPKNEQAASETRERKNDKAKPKTNKPESSRRPSSDGSSSDSSGSGEDSSSDNGDDDAVGAKQSKPSGTVLLHPGPDNSSSDSSSSSEDSSSDEDDDRAKQSLEESKPPGTALLPPSPDKSSSESSSSSEDSDDEDKASAKQSLGEAKPRKTPGQTPSTGTARETAKGKNTVIASVDASAGQREEPKHSATDRQTKRKKADTDSSLKADSDSSDDSSSSSSSSEGSSDESSTEKPTMKPNEKEKVQHGSQGTGEHGPRTKVSLERGEGRQKVSVMLGPRFKGRGWTPGVTTTPKGRDYDLLGNVAVGKWGEEDDAGEESTNRVEKHRASLVASITKQEKSRKKRMFLDGWDAALDRGKKKKVKGDSKDTHRNESQNHRFQKIQASVQKMNRGRAKGFFRNSGGGNKKKGR